MAHVWESGATRPWPCRCYLGAGRGGLGEPSSVAHSAMLLLALAAWRGHPAEEQRQQLMAELAAGLLHQQRSDGTFKVVCAGACCAWLHQCC